MATNPKTGREYTFEEITGRRRPANTPKPAMPARSNKGGALRGKARADYVQGLNETRQAARPNPAAIKMPPRPESAAPVIVATRPNGPKRPMPAAGPRKRA